MAIKFYDEALYNKIKAWFPDNSNMRIFKPDEVSRMFQTLADLNNDKPLTLPIIAISRDPRVGLNIRTKRNMSYDGIVLAKTKDEKHSIQLNAIPIEVNYQIDIYTQTYEEGDTIMREFLFNMINHPKLKIVLPYNKLKVEHTAFLKLLPDVEDNSDIPERIIPGEFTRWTYQLELQDAYIFNTPKNVNYNIVGSDLEAQEEEEVEGSNVLEIYDPSLEEIEPIED